MARLSLNQFRGLNPRAITNKARYGFAEVAHNLDLDDGAINPLQQDVLINADGYLKPHQCGCEERNFNPCDIVSEYVDGGCKRLVVSPVDGEPYHYGCETDCGDVPIHLPVPDPPQTSGGSSSSPSEDTDSVQYLITWVTCLCDESAPSYPTGKITKHWNGSPTIQNIPIPPSYITKINIYRTQVGFRSGSEEVSEEVSEWYLVGSVDPGTTSWTDSDQSEQLGRILLTEKHHPMPVGLKRVQMVPGTLVQVGYLGKNLYYSEDAQPTNWDYKNEMTFDEDIIMIVPNHGFTTVITRSGKYYTVQEGECGGSGCRIVIERTTDHKHLPTGCCTPGIAIPQGNLIPTIDGLLVYQKDGSTINVTERWFDVRDWRQAGSESAVVGYHKGYIYLAMGGKTYRFDTERENPNLTTISMDAQWFGHSQTGEMIYGGESGLYHAFGSNDNREWEWSGTQNVRPAQYRAVGGDACAGFNFKAVSLRCEAETVVPDLENVCFDRTLRFQRRATFTLKGTECVRCVHLASSEFVIRTMYAT